MEAGSIVHQPTPAFRKWYYFSIAFAVFPVILFFGMGFLLKILGCPWDMAALPLEDSWRCDISRFVMPLHWGMGHLFFLSLAIGFLVLPMVMVSQLRFALKIQNRPLIFILSSALALIFLLIGYLVYQQSQFAL